MEYRQPFRGDYPITQRFGETITDPKGHTGIDYACPLGTEILASAEGTVTYLQYSSVGYGNDVLLLHPDGNYTLYAHLSEILVKRWQKVKQGDVIGYSGSTGNSTGPHLHFEMRDVSGKTIDPMDKLHSVIDLPQVTGKLEPGIYQVACEEAFVRDWEKLSRQKLVYKGEPVYVFGEQKWLDDLPFYFIGAGSAMAAYDVDGTIILEKVKDGEEE